MKNKSYIYALAHPETSEIYYIGQSVNPEKRFLQHTSSRSVSVWSVKRWVHSLKRDGLSPNLIVLEECPLSIVNQREEFWILKHHKSGHPLLNQKGISIRFPK